MLDPTIIIFISAAIILIAVYLCWRALAKRKKQNARNQFIYQVLNNALLQKANFDIKFLSNEAHAGLPTIFTGINPTGLVLETERSKNSQWNRQPVEIYFRIMDGDTPVFYVFESRILEVSEKGAGSELTVATPEHLRVEKKRHFERAQLQDGDILMTAIWPVASGRRLPRTASDLGLPTLRWKKGDSDKVLQVENISGSGLALRLQNRDTLSFEPCKGRQIICLVVGKPQTEGDKPLIFWCTAEIMNKRVVENSLALGLEFINWAVQAQDDNEIHWSHNSPWRGVKPVLDWVQRLEAPK